MIKKFTIKNLYGRITYNFDFEENIKILIGENGLGKTTILNILNYVMTKDWRKLYRYKFEMITLVFDDNVESIIDYNDLSKAFEELNNQPSRFYSPSQIADLLKVRNSFSFYSDINDYYKKVSNLLAREVNSEVHFNAEKSDPFAYVTTKCANIIENLTNTSILHFPTFRRIEEELENLGYQKEVADLLPNLKKINFGMNDVLSKLKEIKKKIEGLFSDGFASITSEILKTIVREVPEFSSSDINRIKKADIGLILSRVGNKLSDEDKKIIKEHFAELKDCETSSNKILDYFLLQLVNIHEGQKELDNMIDKFIQTVNKYLASTKKELIYDASKVEFYLKTHEERPVLLEDILNKLSSGEKQIISIFSEIFLSESKNFIILFDEPELSLSVFWQRMLLEDIVNSGKCRFLLAVTHSPYIFDNELLPFAVGIDRYIEY